MSKDTTAKTALDGFFKKTTQKRGECDKPFYKNIWFWLSVVWFVVACSVSVAPAVVTATESKIEDLECPREQKEDDALLIGETKIAQECKNGKKIVNYSVEYKNGEEIGRERVSEEIIVEPTVEITLVGTKRGETPVEKQVNNPPSESSIGSTPTSASGSEDVEYVNGYQSGYCNDGTSVYGNPHARGRANACYGHGGWVGNQ